MLTSPNVSVPDQNGRPAIPDLDFSGSFPASLPAAGFQAPGELFEQVIRGLLRFDRNEPRPLAFGLLVEKLKQAFAVFVVEVLGTKLAGESSYQLLSHLQLARIGGTVLWRRDLLHQQRLFRMAE
jgi:hypothetical protein